MGDKTIEIIAGPNGSGKSTFAESYFIQEKKLEYFINSDTIAVGLSPLDVERVAFQAGRLMLTTIKDRIKKEESFAFESTLSGKTWFPLLHDAKSLGYKITIYFIFLNRVQENISRIKARVKSGGHFVPSETIHRRFPKSFHNFWHVYRHICSDWYIFNNSGAKPQQRHSRKDFEKLTSDEQKIFETKFLRGKINGSHKS